MKTGSTGKAGFCLSATATRNKIHMIAVVMGCEALKQGSKMQELFWTMDFQIASGYTAKLQEKKSEGFQYKRVRDQKYLARKR